jgi:hypothetical protein
MKIPTNTVIEIGLLIFLFTGLAMYLNIHGEHHVINFTINHLIALLIALLASKGIYHLLKFCGY